MVYTCLYQLSMGMTGGWFIILLPTLGRYSVWFSVIILCQRRGKTGDATLWWRLSSEDTHRLDEWLEAKYISSGSTHWLGWFSMIFDDSTYVVYDYVRWFLMILDYVWGVQHRCPKIPIACLINNGSNRGAWNWPISNRFHDDRLYTSHRPKAIFTKRTHHWGVLHAG